jgi:cytochrome c oxidase assembly protein Cox11|uniref:Haem biosynthesis protein n=1 Tax=Naegleria gruberi TaxID=5762 RepID=Q9G8S0_NAEGR|nr:haem biosynthesis protein [Naegleria gruberi]AAG17784.1 haem biosynthesis protein [Naegleria gruberi]
MLYLFYFFFITLNMLFFGVLNIPLFKYFCDIPTYNFLLDDNVSNIFFPKNYYSIFSLLETEIFDTQFNFFFLDFISHNFLFYSSYIIYIYFFFFDLYINNFISSCDYIEVLFQTSTSNYNFVEFCTLQKYIYIIPNETHLIFFRMYNTVSYEITGISIYLLYPTDFLVYFNKIQCFCFEELLLYPYESIDLPVIFFVSNEILNYVDFFYSNKLYLSYLFLVR